MGRKLISERGFARVTMSLPVELKEKMDQFSVNWSKITRELLERFIDDKNGLDSRAKREEEIINITDGIVSQLRRLAFLSKDTRK